MSGVRAMIVDIDGTIARNNSGRPWYGQGYEARLHEDDVDQTVGRVVNALLGGGLVDHVLFVSGRTEVGREATTRWLYDHTMFTVGHGEASLFMRRDGDYRPDHVIKREIYDEHIRDAYDVFLALDDRPEMIDLWRSLGIPAWQVNEYR